MSAKILISGLSNSGKTTLTDSLVDALIVSHDGKSYPFPKPHVNIPTFASTAELIATVNSKIEAYKDKIGSYPKTIVFDSVSKIFDTLMDTCSVKHTGFKIYSELNKEIHEFTDYIQNVLIASDMNVVLISHAIYDGDTATYNLVGKGDFQKRGGFLAEVDNSAFVETKNNKRIVHHRSTKFPARTIIADLPDSQPVEDYNLQQHLDILSSMKSKVTEYEL
jgi:GTPase SAR1 family protein